MKPTLIRPLVLMVVSAFVVLVGCDRSTLGASKKTDQDHQSAAVDKEANDSSASTDKTAQSADPSNAASLSYADVPDEKVDPALKLSPEQWRKRLHPQAFRVLRESKTEPAFSGELLHNKRDGVYTCAGCGKPLFSSNTKFKSGTGWPSFYDALENGTVGLVKDPSMGMERIEVYCTHCGSHLGHIFKDGPRPTGLRYCIDSAALKFEPADSE